MFNLDMRRIDKRNPLASGSFGTIYPYLQLDKKTHSEDWVIKNLQAASTRELKFFIQEAVLGFNHQHPCIVSNQGFDIQDISNEQGEPAVSDVFILMPRMETSMKRAIGSYCKTKPKPIAPTLDTIIGHCFSIAKGLDYLQSKRIVHNNLNPGTILLSKENVARIGGIGLAQHPPWSTKQSSQGTRLYAAPERMDPEFIPKIETIFKGDIWSLGITMMEFSLLGKLEKYYPETNDDWLDLDTDDVEKETPASNSDKVTNVNAQEEETKLGDDRKMEPGTILINENLQAMGEKCLLETGISQEKVQKLVAIIAKTLVINPKLRLSASGLCQELEHAFPGEVAAVKVLLENVLAQENQLNCDGSELSFGDFLEEETPTCSE